MVVADISAGLAGIAGAANVVVDPTQLGAYRVCGHTPKAAVRPGSSQEVAELVRLAASEKIALAPVGARTKLGMNIPLERYDVALDMTRLDRIVSYDPDDLTLSVEPGIGLGTLAGALAEHKQFLPLAVPFLARATAGGTIASGVDSPLRQLYGTARDYVLGMEIVTGDGQMVKSGGRVVKNVSGYDLHKLMIGSLGSLGVVTRINFRTFPAPAAILAFAAFFDSPKGAVEMRQRVAQSPLRPLTLEILDRRAADLLSSDAARHTLSRGSWTFITSYAGTGKVLERYTSELRRMAGAAESILLDPDAARVALGRVREFIPIALESSRATAIVKMSVLPALLPDLLENAAQVAAKSGLRWATIARGVGVVYFALLPDAPDEAGSRASSAVENLREACLRRRGNFALEWAPPGWKQAAPGGETNRGDRELMRKLKSVFDPSGVFAPDPLAGMT